MTAAFEKYFKNGNTQNYNKENKHVASLLTQTDKLTNFVTICEPPPRNQNAGS